jgi:ABC-type transporter Mla subunit MlaD
VNETGRNLLVGLFVLCGLGALGTLIVLFGREPTWLLQGRAYTLNIHFDTATGIREGTVVAVGGITVARVTRVDFRDKERFEQGVSVEVAFDRPYANTIRQGTYAQTTEPGLGMGRPPIVLLPPADSSAPVLASGSTIRGDMVPAMDALFPPSVRANFERAATAIGEAAEAFAPVLDDLHEILRKRDVAEVDQPGGPVGNLSSAIARADTLLKHTVDVVGDPNVKDDLRNAITNFKIISEDGKAAVSDFKAFATEVRAAAADARELMASARESLSGINDEVRGVSRGINGAMELVSRFMTQLNQMGERANAGEGSLGKFLTDDRLFESLVVTFRRMAEAMEEFKLLLKDWQKGKIRVSF